MGTALRSDPSTRSAAEGRWGGLRRSPPDGSASGKSKGLSPRRAERWQERSLGDCKEACWAASSSRGGPGNRRRAQSRARTLSAPAAPLLGSSAPLTLCCRWRDGESGTAGFFARSRSHCSCRSRLRPRLLLSEERASSWGDRDVVTGWQQGHGVRAEVGGSGDLTWDALPCTPRRVAAIGEGTRRGWAKCRPVAPGSRRARAVGAVGPSARTPGRRRPLAALRTVHTAEVSLSTVRVVALHCRNSLPEGMSWEGRRGDGPCQSPWVKGGAGVQAEPKGGPTPTGKPRP